MSVSRALILLALLSFSPALEARRSMAVDDESCSPVTAEKNSSGVWEFVNCGGANCSVGVPCEVKDITSGTTITYYCGCFSDGEPECCHIVLVSTNGGPKLPQASGVCGVQGCPAGTFCMMAGGGANDSTAARNCRNIQPPPH